MTSASPTVSRGSEILAFRSTRIIVRPLGAEHQLEGDGTALGLSDQRPGVDPRGRPRVAAPSPSAPRGRACAGAFQAQPRAGAGGPRCGAAPPPVATARTADGGSEPPAHAGPQGLWRLWPTATAAGSPRAVPQEQPLAARGSHAQGRQVDDDPGEVRALEPSWEL